MKLKFDVYNSVTEATETKSFDGEWIIPPEAKELFAVARTDQGRILCGPYNSSDGRLESYEVFETPEEFYESETPEEIIAQVRHVCDADYIEDLDI